MEKIDGKTMDIVAENVAKLKELFPEAFTEDGITNGHESTQMKIDWDALREVLGEYVSNKDERYSFTWNGKSKARMIAQTPSTGTLRPFKEESVDWDTTQNIFIEGDNLEVLKLLQKSYHKKVKMIYIDPPYNTGKDFVYKDNFKDNIKNYKEITGQMDGEGRNLSSNPETSGRYHTDWLNMMYPRLKLARNLLKDDGAIFVSIDEGEHTRLRSVMDEIFGEENFVSDMVWAAGRKNDSKLISVSHEYIVCYAKDKAYLTENNILWRQKKKGLEDIYTEYNRLKKLHGEDFTSMTAGLKEWYKNLADGHPAKAHKHYSHVDFRGIFFPDNISWPGGGGPVYKVLHPATKKPVKVPSRGWMTSDPKKMQEWIKDERVHFGNDETKVPCIKSYLKDKELQTPYSVFYQDGRAASKRLRMLMGEDCFDFPKDEFVLQELTAMLTSENDLILDFFAGSGTCGHSVMLQNALDNNNRKFLLVQLPEPLDSNIKSQKVAVDYCDQIGKPHNIAELTKERIRRAAAKIKENLESTRINTNDEKNNSCKLVSISGSKELDLGFKVFKLDSTNIKPWEVDFDLDEKQMEAFVENIKPDRREEDILYEILLKYGLDLTLPISEHTIAGQKVFDIGMGALIICLSDTISLEVVEGIAKLKDELDPEIMRVVFKDSGFKDDVVKTNAVQILKQSGISDVRSL